MGAGTPAESPGSSIAPVSTTESGVETSIPIACLSWPRATVTAPRAFTSAPWAFATSRSAVSTSNWVPVPAARLVWAVP